MASAPPYVPAASHPPGSFCYLLRPIVPEMLTKRTRVALLRPPAILCTRSRPEHLSGRLPRWACGEGGWLRGDRQPSPATFPCFLRRLVWLAAGARSQGPCAPMQTTGAGAGRQCGGGPSSGRCECLHDCSMGGVRRVGTLMKPANHRSTEMHSSLRILPSGDPWATSWFLSLKNCEPIQF